MGTNDVLAKAVGQHIHTLLLTPDQTEAPERKPPFKGCLLNPQLSDLSESKEDGEKTWFAQPCVWTPAGVKADKSKLFESLEDWPAEEAADIK